MRMPASIPVQGDDVILTIDLELQAEAERALEGREGVIVALDPKTGEVLALASSPTYDPNRFITRFTPKEWTDLIADPLRRWRTGPSAASTRPARSSSWS